MPFTENEENIIKSRLFGDGTVTDSDLEKLADITATAAELNTLHSVTAGTVTAGKAIVCTTDKHIDALVVTQGGLAFGSGAGTAITATPAELNALHSQGATTTDFAKLHALATIVPSKAAVSAHVADMPTTVAKSDIDDAGTIDGTEVAAALQALNLKVNALIAVIEAYGMTALS